MSNEEKVVVNDLNDEKKQKNKQNKKERISNILSKETKTTMVIRIITAVILGIVVVPTFFFGGWSFLITVLIALAISIHEFLHAAKVKKGFWFVYVFVYVMTISLTFWIFMKNNMNVNVSLGKHPLNLKLWDFWRGFENLEVSTFGVIAILVFVFISVILVPEFDFYLGSYFFIMMIIVGIGFQSLLFLRFLPQHMANSEDAFIVGFTSEGIVSSFLLLYVIIGTTFNDIGAYFVGVLFGRHKLIERISPKKTIEGFIGGIVISFVFSFAFAMICSLTGNEILPFLSHKEWYWLVLLSLLMPLLGNLGDLFFSALKRNFEIKDYGTFLRGHGGILDRLDSILVVSLVVSLLIVFIRNSWSFLL